MPIDCRTKFKKLVVWSGLVKTQKSKKYVNGFWVIGFLGVFLYLKFKNKKIKKKYIRKIYILYKLYNICVIIYIICVVIYINIIL